MNIQMIKSVVLTSLGLSKFIKNDQGNLDLSDEHKKTLAGIFGQPFVDKFVAKLNTEAAEASSSPEEKPSAEVSDDTKDIVEALKAHHSSVVANGLKNLQVELQSEKNKNKSLQDLVDAMSDAAEDLPAAQVASTGIGSSTKKNFKVNAKNPMYQAAQAFLNSGNVHDFSAATIEVTELKTEFGTYLSQNGNNLEIRKKLFSGFTSSKYFTWVRAVTEYRAVRAMITSVTQQFTAKWTPAKGVAFKPMRIVNRRHKINFPIIPAEVLDSYMFKLYDESKSPDQMPITLYIWNELIEPALLQDIEMRMMYKGKFIDHSATQDENDPATAPEDSMDGIETIIVDAKASGDTGMHFFRPNSNFDFRVEAAAGNWEGILNFVNDFVDWLSPWYKTTKMPLFMSPDNLRIYRRAYKKVWGVNSGQDGDFGTDRVDYSNQILASPDGMFNSPIIYSTPLLNQLGLRHINEVPNVINDVQVENYAVKIFGEFWLATGFAYPAGVFAFCPDGYDPHALVSETLGAFDTYQEDYNGGDGEPGSDDSGI